MQFKRPHHAAFHVPLKGNIGFYGNQFTCRVCGKPLDRFHDRNACAEAWLKRVDAEAARPKCDDGGEARVDEIGGPKS